MTNKPIGNHVYFFSALILIILISFLCRIVFAETYDPEAQDKVIEMINKAKLTEKQIIVAEVKHKEIKGPKYTVKVGLSGARKPIPKLNGENEYKRAEQWLNTAGLGYTLETWINLAEKHKIEFTTPICIAWADSHLGKALSSKNNIGNVGNNDRGDRVHYETMDKGIEAIFRALNNKWMGGNTKIGELSGEGRKKLNIEGCNATKSNKKCYATSMGVWSTNVTNCLSALHDKQVDENYEFRLK